jgi:hypothetical protein
VLFSTVKSPDVRKHILQDKEGNRFPCLALSLNRNFMCFLDGGHKKVGSFVWMDSTKVQATCLKVIADIEQTRKERDEEYVQNEINYHNSRRARWSKIPFINFSPLTRDQVLERIKKESRDVFSRHTFNYPSISGYSSLDAANRLLGMSRVENRVAVSSDDWNLVFK